mmetsp:Transcript_10917/g.36867  ORF Transcript_10917/g.36867 Transcript_10917/m.36867 type:complete len:172 (-) Transcript_10917:1103-1618(-)
MTLASQVEKLFLGMNISTPRQNSDRRRVWGAGEIGAPLRSIASGSPAALFLLDNLARSLGIEVVENVSNPFDLSAFEPRTNPATVAARLDSLETKVVLQSSGDKGNKVEPVACPVCLCDFAEGEYGLVFKKCQHSYHAKCLHEWLNRADSCPCCREKVIEVKRERGDDISK